MATWASLTSTQQRTVLDYVNFMRGVIGDFAKVNNKGIAISAAWNGGVSTIVGSLDSGEIIPNDGGLAGAQGVVPADVTNFSGYLIDMSNTANNTGGGGYNTPFHRALMVKFAGMGNTV